VTPIQTEKAEPLREFTPPPAPTGKQIFWSGAGVFALFFGLALVFWGFSLLLHTSRPLTHGFLVLGTLGIARYIWLLINLVRSYLYRFWRFPELRHAASQISQPFPSRVHFIIPTFREKPWVTTAMIKAVCREAASIPSEVEFYVTTGGPDEDEVVRRALAACPDDDQLTVYLMRQTGKRSGMAYALRAIARNNPGRQDGVVVLMDGDTLMGENLLRACLPFFALLPKVGGVTSNSIACTVGPDWYCRWYNLRFALRNRYMSSTSLSTKILTLTGRFSLVRSSIALSRTFIERVETDFTDDWTYGRIDFKTGDDKSTWYELLRQGWDMLYVPDATIYSLENASETPVRESIGKMRRWFGNMLRNNGRALALGPSRIGLFTWVSLLDQRISMWTSLVLPAGMIFLLLADEPILFIYFLMWVLVTRTLYLMALSVEGHRAHPWDFLLLLFQQWVGSLIKIQTFSDLRQQKWGAARGDAKTGSSFFPKLQTALWLAIFFLLVGLLVL